MWFIRSLKDSTFLSVREFPTMSFIDASERNMTEIFKIVKKGNGIIMCSCSNPSVYVGENSTPTLDPIKVYTYPDLNSIFPGCVLQDIYVDNINLTNHIREIDVYGFTIISSVIENDTIDKIKDTLDILDILDIHTTSTNYENSKTPEQIRHGDLIRRDPLLYHSILTIPPIRILLRCYMKDNLHLSTLSSNTLYKTERPRTLEGQYGGLGWHVDHPYHDIEPPWLQSELGSPLSLQTMYILDDFTTDNGATWAIPSSHMNDTFPYGDINIDNGRQITCMKGDIILTHGAWWHSQGYNYTTEPRSCILGTYCKKWIKCKDDILGQIESVADNIKYLFREI